MKTYSAKPSEVKEKWWIVDAQDMVLGRMASRIALVLRGKHRPMFTPHIDTGDHVVVINAEKVKLTGKKAQNKIDYRHTGHPGGIKEATAGFILSGKYPNRVIEKAVERMMPKESPLARQQLGKMRVYAGNAHPHEAQKPEVLDIAKANPKNKR